tara:strand:+ start:7129 stop:7425 length:297 start_codon:yes stop_codon:yes gene_type:complete
MVNPKKFIEELKEFDESRLSFGWPIHHLFGTIKEVDYVSFDVWKDACAQARKNSWVIYKESPHLLKFGFIELKDPNPIWHRISLGRVKEAEDQYSNCS